MLLAIDTTDRGGSVALSSGDRLLELNFEESSRNHSNRLMPVIDSILKKHGVNYSEIDHLAVVRGPGSFTGIRLGVTTAKTLALVCEAGLVAVTNLRLQVEYVRPHEGIVESIVDARRGQLYRQRFNIESGEIKTQNDPHLVTPAYLKNELKGAKKVLMVYRDRSWKPDPADWPAGVKFYCPLLVRPLAAPLVCVAHEKLKKNQVVSPERVKPLYVRPSDAQRTKNE